MLRRVPADLSGPHVEVRDYGIGGMHLAYDLLDGCDALVLVDAIPGRGAPGTLHAFEADIENAWAATGLDAHAMDPAAVFASLDALGGTPPYTVVIACEVDNVDEGIGLSDAVAAAVPDAVRMIGEVVAGLLTGVSVAEG
ncbi:peptidase M52 [Mycobacterium sp. GA-1285]|nr:peptidase M52 [Mycobacterium sp. GA-1285]